MTEATARLEVCDLTFSRGQSVLYQKLSFALSSGQWCLLTGDNGSGKTTLLRILCGLSKADQGQVYWQGSAFEQDRLSYHRTLIYVGHKLGFRNNISVVDNLRFYHDIGCGLGTDKINQSLAYFGIDTLGDRPYATLSQGQRQRVALCRLMIETGMLWLLDEPLSALDNQGRQLFETLLSEHLKRGGIAVVASHKDLGLSGLPSAYQLSLSQ